MSFVWSFSFRRFLRYCPLKSMPIHMPCWGTIVLLCARNETRPNREQFVKQYHWNSPAPLSAGFFFLRISMWGFFSVRFAQIFELWKNVDLEIKAVAQGWMRVYRIEKKSKIHWWSIACSKKSKCPAKTINDKDKQYIHLAGRQTHWFREQKVKTADCWKTSRAWTKASLDLTCIFLTESGSRKWH